MSEPAFNLVLQVETAELTPVDQRAVSFSDEARVFPAIQSSDEYIRAAELWKTGKAIMNEIDEGYDSLIKSAHKLHKDAVAKKAKYYTPVEAVVRKLKGLMAAWDMEQERIRLEEQRRLEEIARKEAEERAILEAIAAEEEAKRNGATQEEAEEEAAAIIEQPVYVPPVVVPKAVPKVQGVSYRELWSAECFDIKALCKGVAEGRVSPECVLPNGPVLNKLATGLKSTMNVPGCRAIMRRV